MVVAFLPHPVVPGTLPSAHRLVSRMLQTTAPPCCAARPALRPPPPLAPPPVTTAATATSDYATPNSSLERVYLPPPLLTLATPNGATVMLPAAEAAHLRARRVRPPASVLLFNGTGTLAVAVLLPPSEAAASVTEEAAAAATAIPDGGGGGSSPAPPPPRRRQRRRDPPPLLSAVRLTAVPYAAAPPDGLTAAVALPAAPASADWAVEKLTELGVARILAIPTARAADAAGGASVAAASVAARADRWRRLAVAAAKQSLRPEVPDVEVSPAWANVLALVAATAGRGEAVWVADVEGVELGALLVPGGGGVGPRGGLLLVGPEGGFTPAEVGDLLHAGGVLVRLGGGRLRVETAAVAAAAAIMMVRCAGAEAGMGGARAEAGTG